MPNLFYCAKTSFTVDHLNDKSQTRDLLNAVFTPILLSVAIKAKLLVNLLTVAIESDSFLDGIITLCKLGNVVKFTQCN